MNALTCTVGLIALSLFSPIRAADDKEDAVKKDLKALQGKWRMVSGANEGLETTFPAEAPTTVFSFEGPTVTNLTDGGMKAVTIRIDPSAKPKHMDAIKVDSKEVSMGIYELNGDELKLCFPNEKGSRPTDFTAKKGSGRALSVWKREKP